MKQRRVGTITAGISLIAVGLIYLFHIIWPVTFHADLFFGFWPLILIALGLEILFFRFKKGDETYEPKFDGGSVAIVVLCILTSCGFEIARQAFLWLSNGPY